MKIEEAINTLESLKDDVLYNRRTLAVILLDLINLYIADLKGDTDD